MNAHIPPPASVVRFLLGRLRLDGDVPMACEVERVREALKRIAENGPQAAKPLPSVIGAWRIQKTHQWPPQALSRRSCQFRSSFDPSMMAPVPVAAKASMMNIHQCCHRPFPALGVVSEGTQRPLAAPPRRDLWAWCAASGCASSSLPQGATPVYVRSRNARGLGYWALVPGFG